MTKITRRQWKLQLDLRSICLPIIIRIDVLKSSRIGS